RSVSGRNLRKCPFEARLRVKQDFGQDNAWRSYFSHSALARSRRIGSQRSARSHLEIFPGFDLSMQPIVSGGQALRRLPEKFTLQKHSMTNFRSLEQDGQCDRLVSYGI